ncbi:MAG: hypothetical protein FWE37_04130 [Spirochaetaceae bacterium]|nr:hypothetical protein [Spirochaetaceae bacterium]
MNLAGFIIVSVILVWFIVLVIVTGRLIFIKLKFKQLQNDGRFTGAKLFNFYTTTFILIGKETLAVSDSLKKTIFINKQHLSHWQFLSDEHEVRLPFGAYYHSELFTMHLLLKHNEQSTKLTLVGLGGRYITGQRKGIRKDSYKYEQLIDKVNQLEQELNNIDSYH